MATEINWDEAPSMTQGLTREQEALKRQELNRTRMSLAGALSPLPVESTTNLPEMGGLLGGLAPLVFPESKIVAPIMALTRKAPAIAQPFLPSLLGSTAGTSAGVLAEQGLTGNILSPETGQKLLEKNVQNAIFDLGGNLAFTVLGKTITVGRDALEKIGIAPKPSAFGTPELEARRAAQEWLSSRDATLTKSQLTGEGGAIEGALKYTTGAPAFKEQQVGVRKALEQGVNDVKSTLDTSDAFNLALKQGDPTQMAIGDRFQNAIKVADTEMKAKYKPIYNQMEKEGDGLLVDLSSLKSAAKEELDRLNKNKAMSSAANDKRAVLEQILQQEDKISFSTAHDLRSDFLASARDASKEGQPASTLEAYYKRYAQGLRNNMDSVAVITFGNEEQKAKARQLGLVGGIDQPAGLRTGQFQTYNIESLSKMNLPTTEANIKNNDLLKNYWDAQNAYGSAMEGLYGGAMRTALKSEPSAVGEYLFDINRPERIQDVAKAVREMQKYLPANQSKGLIQELQYGYINKMFGSPEGVTNFTKKMEDKTFKEGFDYLFRDATTKKQLTDIANAAKYGLEEEGGTTALRTRLVSAGATTATAVGAYLTLPDSVQSQINLPESIATIGALYLTPKFISKALTNKDAMDALAMISKGQKNPKYMGAVSGKIADMLNKSGIIDNEYLNEVNQFTTGKSQAYQPSSQPSVAPINWDTAPQAQPVQ